MRRSDHLAALEEQHVIIRDRIRSVAAKQHNGLFLFGPPGTSKTWLIETTLEKAGVPLVKKNGNLTAVALFDLLEEFRDSVIVLDDLTSIFSKPEALQIFLAALGNQANGRGRLVTHKHARADRSVVFTGGIIATSNFNLKESNDPAVQALADRMHIINYDPSNELLKAKIYDIARNGDKGTSPKDCKMVADFMFSILPENARPTIRLFVDKVLPDFRFWKSGKSESHWHDLVRSTVLQHLSQLTKPVRPVRRQDKIAVEREIVAEICSSTEDSKHQVRLWTDRTGKSQSAFYRRKAEIQI
jgi:hypothetical protein